jgi:hypothetical protein
VDEDVDESIRVILYKIGCTRCKRHRPSKARNSDFLRVAGRLYPAGVNRDTDCLTCNAIVHKHVPLYARVAWRQIRCA